MKNYDFLIWAIIIIVIVILPIISNILGKQKQYDITSFHGQKVDSIVIKDRGIVGSTIKSLNRQSDITNVMRLIEISSKVDNKVNIKANYGLCQIDLYFDNSHKASLLLIKTAFSGGVLASGDYHYRNDSLLNVLIRDLK